MLKGEIYRGMPNCCNSDNRACLIWRGGKIGMRRRWRRISKHQLKRELTRGTV